MKWMHSERQLTFDVEARLCAAKVTAARGGRQRTASLTGCAVSNRLVLTCAHSVGDGVPPLSAASIVRKDALGSVAASGSASTVFVNTALDVRLLSSEIEWNLRPARWGMANGPADLTAQLWGYPWASIRGEQTATYAAEVTIKGAPSAASHRQLTTTLDPRSATADGSGPDPGVVGDLGWTGRGVGMPGGHARCGRWQLPSAADDHGPGHVGGCR